MNSLFLDYYISKENKKILVLGKDDLDITKYVDNKYDIIFLNGLLENANIIFKSDTPEIDMIIHFKKLLNDNGKIYIAVDNKQGVRYLVGNKSEHCDKIYDSINNSFSSGKLFSKTELDEIIAKVNFSYFRYYYPLPNYKYPNVVFTDKKLPNSKNSKLNYNVMYDQNSLIIQDELALIKTFIKEKKFVNFTNSFIVELSNSPIDESIKYCSINNMRKDKYSLIIKMDDEYVKKYPLLQITNGHIKSINKNSKLLKKLGFNVAEEENDKIVSSKIIKTKLLDEMIVYNIHSREKVYSIIDNWYNYICEKLLVNKDGKTKYGFIDMVFENTFYDEINNEYVFFDQEWFQEDLPVKYILYRAINNLYAHNPEINNCILIDEMFDKYDLTNYKNEFDEKEKVFQKEIIDEEKQKLYAEQYLYKITSEEIKQIIKDVKRLDKDNVELLTELKKLDRDNVELIKEIQRYKNENN